VKAMNTWPSYACRAAPLTKIKQNKVEFIQCPLFCTVKFWDLIVYICSALNESESGTVLPQLVKDLDA
jgi:hypothetical protein